MSNEALITGNLAISGTCDSETIDCALDYFFEPDYQLAPLVELGRFVRQNKHLPGSPSANGFYANGINVRIMGYELLEKI